jgi:hypothetical protein
MVRCRRMAIRFEIRTEWGNFLSKIQVYNA